MSRSGYSDDIDNWSMIKWRGQVASAIRGKRGQTFLKDLIAALDAMPEKKLIAHELQNPNGEVCALGALGVARGIDMKNIDPEDYDVVAEKFDIAHQLAQEIVYENDETCTNQTPEERWKRIRAWAAVAICPKEKE